MALARAVQACRRTKFLKRPNRQIKTVPQQQPERHKARKVKERDFEAVHTLEKMVAKLSYRPVACGRHYRVIVLQPLRHRQGTDASVRGLSLLFLHPVLSAILFPNLVR